ncbi:hypothetical protein SLEP1_g4110 [Rubroshorea leprosula]|uniref:Uncharacterized protein n=1 Tax=Rubroshorea leprosula TaxID=152421 RepID=A0AAV5HXB3_9ROSI|nr:hypothetical protein SLEP1_g4110 [Rubroshorea leprosula]
MDSGSMHHFVGADFSCISWGHAQYGELGYGPNGQKSSAVPKKVDILEGMHVINVACGFGLSMVIVDRTNVGDRLEQLDIYDGKPAGEGSEEPVSNSPISKQNNRKGGTKASSDTKKRKKSKKVSDSEDEEDDESSDEASDSSEEQSNGQAEQKRQRVRGRGKGPKKTPRGKGSGRGRGRPPSSSKSVQSTSGKIGKRGRPRKS